ncbi:hypothetical protein [Streptomyces lavendofoliae]|uniref:hypothetical protein n=1 Tax=Streptomyces lavendofoliae TaxID=67314 RepID=UPI003D90F987
MGEGQLVGGAGGIGEGDSEGETDLHHGALAGVPVLFCFGAAGFEGGDGGRGVGVGPLDVAEDAVLAAPSSPGWGQRPGRRGSHRRDGPGWQAPGGP